MHHGHADGPGGPRRARASAAAAPPSVACGTGPSFPRPPAAHPAAVAAARSTSRRLRRAIVRPPPFPRRVPLAAHSTPLRAGLPASAIRWRRHPERRCRVVAAATTRFPAGTVYALAPRASRAIFGRRAPGHARPAPARHALDATPESCQDTNMSLAARISGTGYRTGPLVRPSVPGSLIRPTPHTELRILSPELRLTGRRNPVRIPRWTSWPDGPAAGRPWVHRADGIAPRSRPRSGQSRPPKEEQKTIASPHSPTKGE